MIRLHRSSLPALPPQANTATSGKRWAASTPASRRGLHVAAGLAILIAGSATACSSGGGHSTGVAAGGTSPTTSAPSGASANRTPSTVKATGGGDFCKLVAAAYNKGITQGPQTDTSPAGTKKRFDDARAQSRQAIDAAPSAIKADVQILDEASNKFYSALVAANYDMTKIAPDATAAFSAPNVQAASTRLVAYVKDHCGIDLGGPSTSGGRATPSP